MIKGKLVTELCELFYGFSAKWMEEHFSVEFDDSTKSIKLTMDNINEQDYKWIKDHNE